MRVIVSLSWLVVFLVLSTARGIAQSERNLDPARAARVDQAMLAELEQQQVPGVAIGVIEEGQIVYLKGYGFANVEEKTPMSTATILNWASNSKPIAAVIGWQLVAEGKLDLDADIRLYVPEFPDKSVRLTTRHLLCHQSGIPHYANGKVIPTVRTYDIPDPYADPVLSLDKFNQSPLLFFPGQKTSYSSYAYVLLSAVLQRAGGEDFATQVQRRIAKPLQMESLQLDVPFQNQANWAVSYFRDKAGQRQRTPEEAHYWKLGAGGYKSNVADFAKWAAALINRRVMSAEGEELFWKRQSLADGKVTEWGLGFTVTDTDPPIISHNGSQREVTTRMQLSPRTGTGIVVMCNADFGKSNQFTAAILTALRALPEPFSK